MCVVLLAIKDSEKDNKKMWWERAGWKRWRDWECKKKSAIYIDKWGEVALLEVDHVKVLFILSFFFFRGASNSDSTTFDGCPRILLTLISSNQNDTASTNIMQLYHAKKIYGNIISIANF